MEIDKTKFGKRKFNAGRLQEGKWISGMIKRSTGHFRIELCPNNSCTAATLLPIILKHVEAGMTVIMDRGNLIVS